MLYRICGLTNSGTSTYALDRTINSKYGNVLILSNEITVEKIQKKLKSYEINTGKIIVNNIVIKQISSNLTFDQIEIILDDLDDKYDCVIIDELFNINITKLNDSSYSVFYNDLCEKLAQYSIDKDLDIIISEHLNNTGLNRDLLFDEVMAEFSKIELEDNQEKILTFRSNLENGTPFVKIYERRNNLIRSFNINQYFIKEENEKD